MNCAEGVCPETSNDPKIAIQILDQDKGAIWGFYCNYECALKDVGTTLLHMTNGGSLTDIPDLTPEVLNAEGNPAALINPLANLLESGFTLPNVDSAENNPWHENQVYINEIAIECAKQMQCKVSAQEPISVHPDGDIQPLYLSAGFSVRMVGPNIVIDVGSPDEYNVDLTPGVFKVEDAIPPLIEHIKLAIDVMKNPAATTVEF